MEKDIKEIKLVLPYPPTVNNMYISRGYRKILSPKAKAWVEECLYRNKIFIGVGFGELPIKAYIKLYPPDRRVRDSDNVVKAIFDIGTKLGCYKDDRQIVKHTVLKKNLVRNKGFVEATFYSLDGGVNDRGFYYSC